MKKKMPKSLRKHIRNEKARIRREVLDLNEQKEQINKLYEQFLPKKHLEKSIEEAKK